MPASTAIASFFAPATQAANASASSNAVEAGNDGVFDSLVVQAQDAASGTGSPLPSLIAGSNALPGAETAVAEGTTPGLSPELRSLLASLNPDSEAPTQDLTQATLPSDVSALALLIAQFQQPRKLDGADTAPSTTSGTPAANVNAEQQLLAGPDATAITDALSSLNTGAQGDGLDPALGQLLQNGATTAANALAAAKAPATANGSEAAAPTAPSQDAQSFLQGTTTDTRSAVAQPGQSSGNSFANGGSSGGTDVARPLDMTLQATTPQAQAQPQFQVELAKAQQPAPSGPLLPQVPLEALAVQIARRFEKGMSSFEISLSPAELGKLDISMQVSDDGRVHAVLRAERPETLELLKQDARALETQLRQAGLDVGSNALSFQLSQGNAHRHNTAERNGAFASALNGDPAADDTTTTSYVATRKRDGIDIKV